MPEGREGMESRHFEEIISLVRERSALCFAGRRKTALRSYLEGRVARLGLPGLAQYRELLRSSPAELDELYDAVTINETSFFRNARQFEDLRTRIIPAIEEEKGRSLMRRRGAGGEGPQGARKLRVLSAGCSTGEEPYSLAMTLLDAVRYPLAWDMEILAGDLSRECLRFAAQGCYEDARVKGIPRKYCDRYLRREDAGWVIRDEVKRLVRFVRLNLAGICAGDRCPGIPEEFPGFDIIFCRNVLIYFPIEDQQLLIDALQRLLAPGGYLFTGDAEPLHLYRHDLESVAEMTSLIYRKKTAGNSPPLLALPGGDDGDFRGGVERLLATVADSSLGRRDEAMRQLLGHDLETLVPVLKEAVSNDGNADLRNGAMETLVGFGEAAVPTLVAMLGDANEEVRNFSTVMLGSIGSRSAVPPLILALEDCDPNVRHGAAEALGRIGDSRGVKPLLALLDQGFWLQLAAIGALGTLGNPAAVPRLLDMLDDEILFEMVTQALVRIGDRAALPRLRAAARSSEEVKARVAAQAVSAIEQKWNGSMDAPAAGIAASV